MPTETTPSLECAATPSEDLKQQIMDSRIPKNEREWWARREIERLSRELLEAREALERIANVVGEDEPSIMWPWAQEIARSVLSPKPAETER